MSIVGNVRGDICGNIVGGITQAVLDGVTTTTYDFSKSIPAAFTFTRSGTATYINVYGKRKTVADGVPAFVGSRDEENLVDDFDLTAWNALGGATVSDNGDGSYRVTMPSGGSIHSLGVASPMAAGEQVVLSGNIRLVSGTSTAFRLQDPYGNAVAARLNLDANMTSEYQRFATVVGSKVGTNAFVGLWWRNITSSGTVVVDIRDPQINVVTGRSNQNPSEILTGSAIFNTVNGISVDGNGIVTETEGALIASSVLQGVQTEPSKTNEFTYSDAFDNAAWTKSNVTVVADADTGADGEATLDRIVSGASTVQHSVQQSKSVVNGTDYTISVDAKDNGKDLQIVTSGGISADFQNFDLSAGALGSGSNDGARIADLGNGLYRCEMTFQAYATNTGSAFFWMVDSPTAGRAALAAGDSSSGFYLGAAQFEENPYGTSYIPTEASTVTRSAASLVGTISHPVNNYIYGLTMYPGFSSAAGQSSADATLLHAEASNATNKLVLQINGGADSDTFEATKFVGSGSGTVLAAMTYDAGQKSIFTVGASDATGLTLTALIDGTTETNSSAGAVADHSEGFATVTLGSAKDGSDAIAANFKQLTVTK